MAYVINWRRIFFVLYEDRIGVQLTFITTIATANCHLNVNTIKYHENQECDFNWYAGCNHCGIAVTTQNQLYSFFSHLYFVICSSVKWKMGKRRTFIVHVLFCCVLQQQLQCTRRKETSYDKREFSICCHDDDTALKFVSECDISLCVGTFNKCCIFMINFFIQFYIL